MKPGSVKKTLLFILAVLLTSCTSTRPAQATVQPLRVEYTNWWGDHTMIVAQKLGLFKKYGVAVEPVYFEVFSESLPALATGTLDGGLFSLSDTINTNDSSPLKIVAVYDNGGTNYVIGSSEIGSAASLQGKRIGVPLGSTYELFIIETLKQAGLTTRDVTLVNLPVEDVPASLGSTIDAGYAWDPYASDALAAGANLLFKTNETNTITPDVVVFRQDVLERRPEDVRAFLKAWFEAAEYRKANPSTAKQIIAEALGIPVEDLSEDSYIYSMQENAALLNTSNAGGLTKLGEAIQINADFLVRIGVLSKEPEQDRLVDPSYLP